MTLRDRWQSPSRDQAQLTSSIPSLQVSSTLRLSSRFAQKKLTLDVAGFLLFCVALRLGGGAVSGCHGRE